MTNCLCTHSSDGESDAFAETLCHSTKAILQPCCLFHHSLQQLSLFPVELECAKQIKLGEKQRNAPDSDFIDDILGKLPENKS